MTRRQIAIVCSVSTIVAGFIMVLIGAILTSHENRSIPDTSPIYWDTPPEAPLPPPPRNR